ncbi:FG-GAP-like repeat-containing protein, partial [Reichenbachiella sp. MALMAid0571]|uniref:FG-GAP-like repeat-containing protein n=2 Tax=Reichenbachiella sp. MALMAid0571 TaxID=3143939 RepID=UPI0032DFFE3D
MKSYRKTLLLLPFVFNTFFLFGQETCDDGVDNDNDGFIDCYDGDCTNNADCSKFYFGNSVICQNPPTDNPTFALRQQWGSDNGTANNSSLPAVGDVDGDGIPEVVVSNRATNRLSILNGIDGQTEKTIITDPYSSNYISHDVTIADINGDECAEIFMAGAYTEGTIMAFDCNLSTTPLWETRTPDDHTGAISVADFDQDGTPELMVGNGIYNASTGAVIISPSSPMATKVFYGTTAIDILEDSECDDCEGLEMVAGGIIYSIDIASKKRTVVKEVNDLLFGNNDWNIDDYSGNYNMNFSAVADYNLDGHIDVLFNGKDDNGRIVIFFWDVENSTVLTFKDLNDQYHWLGTGRINISDLDNDGQLNAAFVSDQTLYALDENFDQLWEKGITEGSSGITGCSVFDFNDDGSAEVLYRSETTFHIIDGTNGFTRTSKACISLTWDEYPIVADVDGDGQSEICLACATSNGSNKNSSSDGQIRVYESDGEDWQPSREVWNQHAYFNVNVNDDLTIPRVQQNPSIVYSLNQCDGSPGANRPLNTFLNQSPILGDDGCPSYVSPDIKLGDNIVADQPQCPDTNFNVSFDIENSGDVAISSLIPVTFYAGDPAISTSTKLNTSVATLENLDIGETTTITLEVQGPGGSGFELFVSINDNGSKDPPVASPIGTLSECDDTNNIGSTDVTSIPFEIFVTKVKNNELCDPELPNNGIASAYYIGSTEATTSVIWSENFEGSSHGDTQGQIDPNTSQPKWTRQYTDDGDAQVRSSSGNKRFWVSNADEEVTWTSGSININSISQVDISWEISESGSMEDEDYIRLYYEVDGGGLQAITDNGQKSNDFGSATATASFTNTGGTSLVLIAKILNSRSDENHYMDNISVTGVTPASSGQTTSGATFRWYNGTDFASGPVFEGATFNTMPNGTYSVVAELNSNACPSDPVQVTIGLVQEDPVIKINRIHDLTDCANPDGELQAVVVKDGIDVIAGYEFTWFIGNDFIDTLSVSSTASNLEARTYSVVVKNNISGCQANLSEDVNSSLILPGIQEESITDVTACNNLNGGSITVSSGGQTAGFTFNWYNGTSVKAVPDYTGVGGAGSIYNGITFGSYTVEAVDNSTGCNSAPLTLEVQNLTGAPEAEFVKVNDNSCASTGGNGSITATSGGQTTGFTFEFYEGVSTSPSDKINTNLSGGNNSIAGSLADGDYTVVITNNSNACSVTNLVTLDDTSVNPDILDTDIDVTDRTACNGGGADPDNGAIDAVGTAFGGSGNYEYVLWNGAASGSPLVTNNTGLFEQLGSGNYSLKVTDLETGCISDVSDLRINLVRDEPIIGLGSSTPNTNCASAGGNGTLTVTAQSGVSEPLSGYEFKIYEGNNTQASNLLHSSIPITGDDNGASYTFTGLLGGNYRVYIRNIGNNCDQTEDFTITNNSSIPVLDPLVSTAQRSCSTPNGGLFALVDDSGDGFSDYDFKWYAGDLASGPVISTSNDLTGVAAGKYTVTATSKTTGCTSAASTGTVNEQLELPAVVAEVVNSQSNCSNANGSLKAYTTDDTFPGVEFTDNFTFEWYLGNSAVGTPISAGVDPGNGSNPTFPLGAGEEHTIGGLVTDTYTVEVTSDVSGCVTTKTIVLTESIILPVVTGATVQDNTGCTGNFTGSVTAAVSYNGSPVTLPDADYTFNWYTGTGTGTPHTLGAASNVLSNLQDGDYTVTVVNNAVGCESDPKTYTVNLSPGSFDIIVTTESPNTNCAGDANGHLSAAIEISGVAQNTTDYTFEWFDGANTTTSLSVPATESGTNNSEAINLDAATYTVRATNIATGCSFTATGSISDVNATSVITGSSKTGSADCNAGTGSITISEITETANGVATVTSGAATIDANFTLELFNESMVSQGNINTPSTSTLSPGIYYVVATNTAGSGCDSDPFQITINDASVTPVIAIVEDSPDAACSGGTASGGLSATVDETAQGGATGVTANYTFQWYEGSDLNDTSTPVPNGNGGNTATISNVAGGDYFVVVTDGASPNNGCEARLSFTLSEDNPVYSFLDTDVTLSHISECTGSATGSFSVADVQIDGVSNGGLTGFSFELTNGMGVSQATNATGIFNGLAVGTYYVTTTNTTTNCESVPYEFEILDGSIQPQLSIAVTANNTSCAGSNGQLTVTVDNPDGGNYSYTWHSGADVNVNAPIGQTTATATGLAAGSYWVLVEDDDEVTPGACQAKISATIIDDPAEISVDDFTPVASTQCSPGNGTVTVDQITINGVVTTDPAVMADYTFQLWNSTNTAKLKDFDITPAGPATFPQATDLLGGTYYIRVVENAATACSSPGKQITIGENFTLPALSITETPNAACTDGTPDGQLAVNVTNHDGNTYSYQWYLGVGTGTPLANGVNPTGPNESNPAGVTTANVSGLFEDTYTVVVTVTNSGGSLSEGCTASTQFTLTSDPTTITLDPSFTLTNISECTGAATGSLDINGVLEDGAPVGGATYTYTFYDNGGTELTTGNPASVIVAAEDISGLAAGSYYVVVENTTTACTSANIGFDILDGSVQPQLSIAVTANNTSCAGSNGQLTVTVDNPDGGNYSYTWYNGADVNVTASPTGDATAGTASTTNATAANLAAGSYWVLVEDDDSPGTCLAKISATIIDDPANITVDAVTTQDVTKCSAANGKITVDEIIVDGVTINTQIGLFDYTFDLYDNTNTLIGTFANQGVGIFPSTSATLSAGTYYVLATEKATTNCPSAAFQVDIDNISVAPVLVTSELQANTICSGTPDGSADVSITGGSGTYSYQWYEGNDLNDTGNPVAGANGGTIATITNMDAGFYWVLVTDTDATTPDNEGCSSRELVEITEDFETLVIDTFGKVNNTNCSPTAYNGSATVTQFTSSDAGAITTPFTGYEFVWYNSDGSVVAPLNITNTRSDLAPGSYKVTVKHSTSKCESVAIPFTIVDDATAPDLTLDFTKINSTSCNVASFANGSISVDPDNTDAPASGAYSYQWYTGSVATGTPLGGATTTGFEKTGLAPGVYSVKVTNTTTGCSASRQATISQDETVNPTIDSYATGKVTSCMTPDGTITVTGLLGGAAINPSDYTWYWFEDATTTTPLSFGVINDNVVTGLDERTYSVYFVNDFTGCTSNVEKIKVERDPLIDITINLNETQPGTCNGANGELRIEATDPSGTHQFTFEVYKGQSDLSGTPILIASSTDNAGDDPGIIDNNNPVYNQGNGLDDGDPNDYIVSQMINDTYTIVATDLTTGCTERLVHVLFWADVQRVDVDPLVKVHSENCKPYADGTGGATGLAEITMRIPALNLTAQDEYQLFLYTSPSIDPEPDMLIGSGEWRADGTDMRPSSIQSVAGSLGGAARIDLTTDTYINHAVIGGTGDGAFLATEIVTGGTSTAQGTITAVNGGQLTITINNGLAFTAGETITTPDGDNAVINTFLADKLNDYTFSGLTAGVYAVVAAQEATNFCYSPPITFEILDETDDIEFASIGVDAGDGDGTDDAVEIVSNMDCSGDPNTGNGSITIYEITRGAQTDVGAAITSNYNFIWHEGPTIGSNVFGAGSKTGFTDDGYRLLNIPGGQYLVEIEKINDNNGDEEECSTTMVFTVPTLPPTYTIVSHTAQNVDDCNTKNDGSITIGDVNVTGAPEAFTGLTVTYDFLLYKGAALINGGAPDNPVVTGLDEGTYTLYIQNTASQCLSDPYYVEIIDDHTDPDLSSNVTITPNTRCNGTTDARNGAILVENVGPTSPDLTIQWLVGDVNSVEAVDPSNITSSNDDTQISGVGGGTYTLVVTDTSDPDNGCSTYATYVIPDNSIGVTTFAATKTDAQDCTTPSNGRILITSVTQTSGTISTPATITSTFDFIVYNEDFSSSFVDTDRDISGLNAGTYFVVAENTVSQCQSDPIKFVIDDVSVNPALTFTIDSQNTTCSTDSGEVTVNYTSDGGTYTHEWFVGSDVSDEGTPFVDGVTPSAQTAGSTTANVSGLPAGTYWVKVKDTSNPSEDCASRAVVTIKDVLDDISVAIADITITPASDCSGANATGIIEVTDVRVGGTPQGTAGYTFEFFAEGNINAAVSTNNPYASVTPGDYFVVATDATTGCNSAPVQVTMTSVPTKPDLDITVVNTTSCAANNGSITVAINDPNS